MVSKYRPIAKEVKDYIRGLYGRPTPILKELLELTKEEAITLRPADVLHSMWEKIESEVPIDLVEKDYLSYALLPNVALEFM